MTDARDRLMAAQSNAAAQRERAAASLAELQARLNPRRMARKAVRDATDAGEAAATVGLDTARRHPGALAGIVAVAGLFLARHRIAHLFRHRRDATAIDKRR